MKYLGEGVRNGKPKCKGAEAAPSVGRGKKACVLEQRGEGQGQIAMKTLELVPNVTESPGRVLTGEHELTHNLTGLHWLVHGAEARDQE